MADGKKRRIAGWILSGLIAAMLIGASGIAKFVDFEGKEEQFAKLGWDIERMKIVGIVEITIAILFLIPRTSFVAAILLAGYLGGASATHVRVGDPFFIPILLGVLVWVALGLRRPEVFTMAAGERTRADGKPRARQLPD